MLPNEEEVEIEEEVEEEDEEPEEEEEENKIAAIREGIYLRKGVWKYAVETNYPMKVGINVILKERK